MHCCMRAAGRIGAAIYRLVNALEIGRAGFLQPIAGGGVCEAELARMQQQAGRHGQGGFMGIHVTAENGVTQLPAVNTQLV